MKNATFIRDNNGWRTLEEEQILDTPYLQVHEETVATPLRPDGLTWIVAHRRAAAVIAPITATGKLILVRQERVPVRRALWEFPAGQVDETTTPTGRQIRATALRELREETGWCLAKGGKLMGLGHYFTSPGFTTEHAWLFLAKPVVEHLRGPKYDDTESISHAETFSRKDLRDMIACGEIQDANTLATVARLVALKLLKL